MAITRTPRTSSGSTAQPSAIRGLAAAVGSSLSPTNWNTSTKTALVSGGQCPSGSRDIGGGMCQWIHNGQTFSKAGGAGSSVAKAASSAASSTGRSSSGSGGTRSGGGSSGGGAAVASGSPVSVGGTTSAGSPTVTGDPATSQWSQAAMDIFAQDPQAMMTRMVTSRRGLDDSPGIIGMLEPYADALNALYMAQGGSGEADDFLGYAQNYWNALQTPGERIDTRTALNNIFNADSMVDSPLHSYIATGDPRQQADATLGLVRAAMQTGYHPLFARAVMDRLNLARDRYLGSVAANGTTKPFYDYIRSHVAGFENLFG